VVSSGRGVGFTRVVVIIASLCYDEKSDERVPFSKRVCARAYSL
jgi:hypothetical protein